MTIRLTNEPIEYQSLVEATRSSQFGAVVLFLGTVREMSEGRGVESLEYESYPKMAEAKLRETAQEAQSQWPIGPVTIVHRYGRLELGDIAVAVVTAGVHRAEAFEAARWVMDRIKQVAPIWKKENWADGSADWVHPVPKAQAEVDRG